MIGFIVEPTTESSTISSEASRQLPYEQSLVCPSEENQLKIKGDFVQIKKKLTDKQKKGHI